MLNLFFYCVLDIGTILGMHPDLNNVQFFEEDERIIGRPFGFWRPFWGRPFWGRPFGFGYGFGSPFLGGVLGGVLGSALIGPYGYGYGYGYPFYPYW